MASASAESSVEQQLSDPKDVGDLHQYGYAQSLRRTMGPFASFSVAFSMVSITTAIFFLLPSLFGTSGAVGVWLWLPCAAGVFLIVMVYSHLAARIPITGFAYQWNSRLINPHYGWFTGYTALLAFIAGTAATAVALATVFAGDIWSHPSHGDIVLLATGAMVAAAVINIVSIRLVSAVNNVGVFFEIVGSVVAALHAYTRPIVLIAGGRSKGTDFVEMGVSIRQRARALVVIGEAADEIAAQAKGVETVHAASMIEAVQRARELAASGDVVLLSPGCASFDMFRSAEDRGEQFTAAVHALREPAGA